MYKRELQKAAAEQSKGEWRLKEEGKGLEPEPGEGAGISAALGSSPVISIPIWPILSPPLEDHGHIRCYTFLGCLL